MRLARDFGIAILLFAPYLLQANSEVCDTFGGCKLRECTPSIRLEEGRVCGRWRRAEDGSKYASFRGLRYGKPPIGDRRFQELEPVEPWGEYEVFEALEDGYACPQDDFIYGRFKHQPKGQDEDCCNLNLHVPYKALPNNKPNPWYEPIRKGLPILVFIHEGAFQAGSGLSDFCGPEYLLMRDIIVITFNYRLNVFGFLSLNCKEVPGNQGLRDMVTLLRWVQRNARCFGGDPDNVTIMGHSGGGTSAHILSLSESTKGLFKRIIAMSCNAFPAYYTASPLYAKHVADMFLQELGINETDPKLIHRELINTSLVKIMDANTRVQYKQGFVSFNPVVEKPYPGITTIMKYNPMSLIAQGRAKHYSTLISFTNQEMNFCRSLLLRKGLMSLLEKDPTAIVSLRLLYSLPEAEIIKIADLINKKYFNSCPTLEGVMKYYTDMYFKHPGFKVAEWRAAMGGAPVYMYQYAYEAEDSVVKRGFWTEYSGAAHFEDYVNIFRANSILEDKSCYPPKNDDDSMKLYMVDIVTNFMYCGNPTCEFGNTTSWPPVSKEKILYNHITSPYNVQMMEPTAEERDIVSFFDSFDPEVRNISSILAKQGNIDSLLDEEYFNYYSQFCEWK